MSDKLVNVALKPGQMPRDVEGFPDGAVRSCEGALSLSESFKPITTDELKHIKDTLPDLYASLYQHDASGWYGNQAKAGAPDEHAEVLTAEGVDPDPAVAAASPEAAPEAAPADKPAFNFQKKRKSGN